MGRKGEEDLDFEFHIRSTVVVCMKKIAIESDMESVKSCLLPRLVNLHAHTIHPSSPHTSMGIRLAYLFVHT